MQEISDDTDLTYYDRTRLESEFRKVKELKHKAEQYAVEAKQTAQRLSAENFKLKEDLSREQHLNELERKNMLREMETKFSTKGGEDEREDAKKEIVEQTIHQKAQEKAIEMAATMKDPSKKGAKNIFQCMFLYTIYVMNSIACMHISLQPLLYDALARYTCIKCGF